MSELILVRHGQATPFEADTDQLSALGEQQARAVGQYLTDYLADHQPTHVLHGALLRQRRTALLASGAHWPAPTQDARLSEFDGDGLMGKLAPLYAAQNPDFAALVAAFREQRNNANFQRMLESLAAAWQAGAVTHEQVESWADFRARVSAALADILALPAGSRVVAFTSGGVIGLMVALCLEAPDEAALKLNWRVKNSSLTRFTFSSERISLDSFNEVHHLPSDLISWR